MSGLIEIEVNGRAIRVPHGITLAAALLNAGVDVFRTSVRGTPRGPLCGMGACYECRVSIEGVGRRRACLQEVRPGLRIFTDG